MKNGKGIIAFSPLAQGMLTEHYLNGIPADSRAAKDARYLKPEFITPEKVQALRALNAIAEERGETLARMALKWVMRDGAVTSVLVGASRPEQLIENCRAFEGSPLGEEELVRIDAATAGL